MMNKIRNPWVGMKGYNCIGCSPNHPFGFHLHFFEEGDDIVSEWKPTPDYQGWTDTLHGGVQALLLDEICGWVVTRKLQTAGVTSKMETIYKRPISTNEPVLKLRARITETRRNIITVYGTISNSAGQVCTKATCTYFTFSKEKAEQDMHFKRCETEGEYRQRTIHSKTDAD